MDALMYAEKTLMVSRESKLGTDNMNEQHLEAQNQLKNKEKLFI